MRPEEVGCTQLLKQGNSNDGRLQRTDKECFVSVSSVHSYAARLIGVLMNTTVGAANIQISSSACGLYLQHFPIV